jgi:antitoxin VapB
MGQEYTAKSFKSGNSVAIRIPAAVGVEPDREWIVEPGDDGDLVLRAKHRSKRKFNIEKVWGCAARSGLRLLKDEDRLLEERPLLWDEISRSGTIAEAPER